MWSEAGVWSRDLYDGNLSIQAVGHKDLGSKKEPSWGRGASFCTCLGEDLMAKHHMDLQSCRFTHTHCADVKRVFAL